MVFVLLFGLIIGSFLNAVIYRLEVGDSALRGRSYCPHCKHDLAWYDLIPIFSFFLLGGRCRYCKNKISWQYPLVELGTALVFVALFWVFGFGVEMVYLLTVASLLVVLFVYDLKQYILPDKIIFPAIGVVLGYRAFEILSFENLNLFRISDFVLSALGAAAFFLAIFLVSRGKAMGFGDVKLALFMGLFLGWPNILVALFIAFMAGGIVGVFLILLKKKGMKSEVPFGPFLIAGTFVALFFGNSIIEWYVSLSMI